MATIRIMQPCCGFRAGDVLEDVELVGRSEQPGYIKVALLNGEMIALPYDAFVVEDEEDIL